MNKISELSSKRNGLLATATELVNAGLKTPEQKEQHKNLVAQIDEVQEDIDMLTLIERKMPTNTTPALAAVVPPVVARAESKKVRRTKVNNAWRSFLKGKLDGRVEEQRDLTTAGGMALIPQEYESSYAQAIRMYGPIASLVKVSNETTGRPRKFVVSDDTTATMSYVVEGGNSAPTETDATLSSSIVNTDTLVTTVKFSLQELEDAFDLGTFLTDTTGLRVARAVEYALTLGRDNGTNTALPNSPAGGLLGSVTAGATTASLSAGITYANLAALASSVDHAYFVNGACMASQSVHDYLMKQVDTTGKPLYKFDPVTGNLVIAGKQLFVNAAMPAYNAASSPVALFGDFSRAYTYLNGGGIRMKILKERYIDTLDQAVVVYHRIGAAKLVPGAVKSLMTAAS